jgi:hypothetical protein
VNSVKNEEGEVDNVGSVEITNKDQAGVWEYDEIRRILEMRVNRIG